MGFFGYFNQFSALRRLKCSFEMKYFSAPKCENEVLKRSIHAKRPLRVYNYLNHIISEVFAGVKKKFEEI